MDTLTKAAAEVEQQKNAAEAEGATTLQSRVEELERALETMQQAKRVVAMSDDWTDDMSQGEDSDDSLMEITDLATLREVCYRRDTQPAAQERPHRLSATHVRFRKRRRNAWPMLRRTAWSASGSSTTLNRR